NSGHPYRSSQLVRRRLPRQSSILLGIQTSVWRERRYGSTQVNLTIAGRTVNGDTAWGEPIRGSGRLVHGWCTIRPSSKNHPPHTTLLATGGEEAQAPGRGARRSSSLGLSRAPPPLKASAAPRCGSPRGSESLAARPLSSASRPTAVTGGRSAWATS